MSFGAQEGEAIWRRLVERARGGDSPLFTEQWAAFCEASALQEAADGPLAVWTPEPDAAAASNLGQLMSELEISRYEDLHRWSTDDRAAFWERAIHRVGVVWSREPATMLDASGGAEHPVWAPGARLNIVESCFKAPDQVPAVVSEREGDDRLRVVTYGELGQLCREVAGGLRRMGCRPGDAVALYMPMTAECVAAYLGIVYAGCRAVSIADSFSAGELRKRLEIGEAVAVVTVDRFRRAGKTITVMDRVREANAARAIVIELESPVVDEQSGSQQPGDRRSRQGDTGLRDGDLGWREFLGSGESGPPVAGDPYGTINVLFSSGTTGKPKAIPWTHLTPIKCAVDEHLHLDIRAGDVVAWPTNVGWMMGPWLIFASLINGATIALYDGAPTGGEFVRFVERAGVTVLGVVPSLVRAWRRLDDSWPADWRRVRLFSSTGEPSSREDYLWLMSRAEYRAPVIEYCGGTEIGGAYITGTVVQPASPATFTTPALGLDLLILDDSARPVGEQEEGEVFLVPPAIGLSQRLLNGDHHEVYFAGAPTGPEGEVLRRHGDRLGRLARGFYRAQGRADDTMNLGGIKVGALELERVLRGHQEVRECAAIGVQPGGEGAELLVVFAVTHEQSSAGEQEESRRQRLREELGARLAEQLNPLFRIHDLVIADSLPYTATNKLMRRALVARYVSESDSGNPADEVHR